MTPGGVLQKIGVSLATLAGLTVLLLVLFRDNLGDFAAALAALSPVDALCLLAMGLLYQLMDSLICYRLIHCVQPAFRYRQAVEVTFLGVFGNVSTFAAGSVPMQAYYLRRCGVDPGRGVGIMTLEYVLHKASMVLFATAALLAEGRWLRRGVPNIHGYILAGYAICTAIICAMVLLCTWGRAHQAGVWLLDRLPRRGKWAVRRQSLREQLDCLYAEARATLGRRRVVLTVFALNFVKLALFCAVPRVCTWALGDARLTLGHTEVLTALMLLIAGAIPNVAGMGPTEFAFFLLYRPLLADTAASALLLFRLSTYYFPFLLSVGFFLTIQLRLLGRRADEPQRAGE